MEIGFDNYYKYLKSKLWKKIRSSQLSYEPRCVACGKRATQVHHRSYNKDILLKWCPNWGLESVCRQCHQVIEHDGFGKKRDLHLANHALDDLIEQHEQIINTPSYRRIVFDMQVSILGYRIIMQGIRDSKGQGPCRPALPDWRLIRQGGNAAGSWAEYEVENDNA
jgi:hypothetical protein